MKKFFIFSGIMAVLLSCQSKTAKNVSVDNETAQCEHTQVYKGLLPAADCSGIEYTLGIDTLNDSYHLTTVYIDAEGTGKNLSFTSEGKRSMIHRGEGEDARVFYKLTPCGKDTASVYFMVVNDSTLRLVNADLQEPTNKTLYDIVTTE